MTANRREVAAFFAPVRAGFAAVTPRMVQRLLEISGVSAVIATGIYVFLDPDFPSKPGALPYALGMLLAFAAIIAIQVVTWQRYVRRHVPDAVGGWTVYPGQVALSIACVAVSRLANFVPGLVFGMSGGDPGRRSGRSASPMLADGILLTYGLLLAFSLTAWIVSIPVSDAADETGASAAMLTLMLRLL